MGAGSGPVPTVSRVRIAVTAGHMLDKDGMLLMGLLNLAMQVSNTLTFVVPEPIDPSALRTQVGDGQGARPCDYPATPRDTR